jgi:pilus assembly protein CpaE
LAGLLTPNPGGANYRGAQSRAVAGIGAGQTLRLVLVSTQESTRDQVSETLADCVGDCRLYWVSQPDLANARIQDLAPDTVLVDDELGGADPAELVRQLTAGLPEIAVLLLVGPDAMPVAREAVLAGARGFVTKPLQPEEMLAALRQVQARRAMPPQVETGIAAGRVVTFCAPKGGTGRTTLAINTAISLRQLTGESVVLVDADYAAPAVDVALNLPADHNITELLPKASELDPELVAGVLATHGSGVQVLLAPPPGDLAAPISLPQVQRVTLWLKRMFSWVIVDLGLPLDETAYAFLDMADLVVMSVLPEMVGLRNARLMLDQLHSRNYPEGKVWPVLNREGMPGGIPVDDLEDWLGEKTRFRIPNDQELATETINRGVPMVVAYRRSATARAYRGLAEKLTVAMPAQQEALISEPPKTARPRARARLDVDRIGRIALVTALAVLFVAFATGVVMLFSSGRTRSSGAVLGQSPASPAAATQELALALAAPTPTMPRVAGTPEAEDATVPALALAGAVTAPEFSEPSPTPSATLEGEVSTGDQALSDVAVMSTRISATALAASTPEPTRTPTDTAEPTSTPTITMTPSPSPTVPTNTPVPSSTPTRRPRPTATRVVPTQTPTSAPAVAPSLVAPASDQAVRGEVTFLWQPAGPLPAGAGYEVVWWNVGEDPAAARGIAPPTTGTSLVANLDVLYQSGQLTSSRLYWTVLVVRTSPYQRLTQPGASTSRVIVIPASSGGGGGGPSPPKPK